jgi:hypothetical protein
MPSKTRDSGMGTHERAVLVVHRQEGGLDPLAPPQEEGQREGRCCAQTKATEGSAARLRACPLRALRAGDSCGAARRMVAGPERSRRVGSQGQDAVDGVLSVVFERQRAGWLPSVRRRTAPEPEMTHLRADSRSSR